MYNYSPITKLKVRNFRNIGDVEIDFTKSPIVTLVGENEAGKTSVIKAFSTCALHANPRDQKDYIRDNTKMFGVEIDLEDGTQIVRVKENGGVNLYRVIHSDGSVWDTTKISEGLPEEVSRVMGLICEPETNEYLHVRTYEDKLLFIVTPNSTNYKVMYNALKVEQLTKAIKIGSNEANALKSRVNNNDVSIQTLNNQLKSISIVDIDPAISIKDRLKQQLQSLSKLEKAIELSNKVNSCEEQLGALGLLDRFNLQPVNEILASNLSNIYRLLNNRTELEDCKDSLKDLDNIEEIDLSVLNKLESIVNKKEQLRVKTEDAGVLIHVNEISEISETMVLQLNKVKASIERAKSLERDLGNIDTTDCIEVSDNALGTIDKLRKVHQYSNDIISKNDELGKINDYIEQVQNYLTQCGVAVETCPKCGEAVIFDIDKLGGI